MPSRGEVVSQAQRLTHIELRLDAMQARLDELVAAPRQPATPPPDSPPRPAGRARKPADS